MSSADYWSARFGEEHARAARAEARVAELEEALVSIRDFECLACLGERQCSHHDDISDMAARALEGGR